MRCARDIGARLCSSLPTVILAPRPILSLKCSTHPMALCASGLVPWLSTRQLSQPRGSPRRLSLHPTHPKAPDALLDPRACSARPQPMAPPAGLHVRTTGAFASSRPRILASSRPRILAPSHLRALAPSRAVVAHPSWLSGTL